MTVWLCALSEMVPSLPEQMIVHLIPLYHLYCHIYMVVDLTNVS